MKDELKKALQEIQDEIIQEDLAKEKNTPPLDDNFIEQIYREIHMSDDHNIKNENNNEIKDETNNENNKKENNKKIIKGPWNWKKLTAIAAASAIFLLSITQIPNLLKYSSRRPDKTTSEESKHPNSTGNGSSGEIADEAKESAEEAAKETTAETATESGNGNIPTLPTIPEKTNEKIIYYFSYTIQTTDYKKTDKSLKDIMSKTNSYIENGNVWQSSNDKFNAEYTIRVPKDKSSQFQSDLSSLGTITQQSVRTENKTKSYKDMESYLKTLEIREERFQKLLEKADKMEDIIMINNELSNILSEKEQYKKDLDQIDYDVDYQYFTVNVSEVNKTDPSVGTEGGLMKDISDAFQDSLDGLQIFFSFILLSLIRNWYIIVILLIVAVIIFRKIRKRK